MLGRGGRLSVAAAAVVASFAAAHAATAPRLDEAPLRPEMGQGYELAKAGKAAKALKLFEEIDQKFSAAYASGPRVFCSRGAQETVLYMTKAAAEGRDAIAIGPLWCDAIYYEAYVLTDLGRAADAANELDRVLTMAPDNSVYLNERAELLMRAGQHDRAVAMYKLAEQDSQFMPDEDAVRAMRSRACRGVGYILTEEGKLDESEADYSRCLTIDPDDQKSKNELAYIAQLRAKKKK
jgi:tetratricopeptide (TPR) repeat protein